MSFGESMVFAAVMTLMDEIKNNDPKETQSAASLSNNEVNIEFSYDNLQVKDRLAALLLQLSQRADEATGNKNEIDADVIVSCMINGLIYESTVDSEADYDTLKNIYNFAMEYCNVKTEFTWDLLRTDDKEMENMLSQLMNMCLNMIFVTSSVGGGQEISTKFIQLLNELMLHLEGAVNRSFADVKLKKRFPAVAAEKLLAAMEQEMRRLEENDPSLKAEASQPKDNANVNRLRVKARKARDAKDLRTASMCYREILKEAPNDGEATFYATYCSVRDTENAASIPSNATHIAKCAEIEVGQLKKLSMSRMEIISELLSLMASVCDLATKYFVTAMNTCRKSGGGSTAEAKKVSQVNGIIQMLFAVGSSVEKNFNDDKEICKNIVFPCWKMAFDVYENCNMNAPENMYEYYLKTLNYEPNFKCSKPLKRNTSGKSSGGCYIATAVYGSYDCPQVWTLRRFRDCILAQHLLGRAFIRFYYATSPTIVKILGNKKWFTIYCQRVLNKVVARLNANGFENTPYSDRPISY